MLWYFILENGHINNHRNYCDLFCKVTFTGHFTATPLEKFQLQMTKLQKIMFLEAPSIFPVNTSTKTILLLHLTAVTLNFQCPTCSTMCIEKTHSGTVLLTQLGKSDQVGTRWQRSRRIRMIITQDCRPLALALRAIQNQINQCQHLQQIGLVERLKHHCSMEAQIQDWNKSFYKFIPWAAIYSSILYRVSNLSL